MPAFILKLLSKFQEFWKFLNNINKMSTEIQENISNEITENESSSAKAKNNKIKDPRKVAAGKKLAEKNKIAREALKKQREEEEKENNSSSWLHSQQFYLWLELV